MKEEIKIYRSVWRNALLILCCLAFAAGSVLILLDGNEKPLKVIIAAWTGILFFGLGGLFVAYFVLKELLTRIPYLVITDEKVIMNGGKPWEASLADVEIFFLTRVSTAWMIGIKYKKNIEAQRLDNASQWGRALRNFNLDLTGAQESIAATGLTVKPQVLCDLLNERLEESRQR